MGESKEGFCVDFIAVGPGKSGTSWLYNVLKNHPEIQLSSTKETLYFERYYGKGETWYHSLFDQKVQEKLYGEISNTYIFDKEIAERIYNYNPKIKIITTLRNPIDRTFSHYLYMLKVNEERGSFKEVLQKRPDLIKRGSYFNLIKSYDKFFSKRQNLILLFEDLVKDNRTYANQITDFLEISSEIPQELLDEKILKAGKARSPILSSMISKLADVSRDIGFPGLVTKVKYNKSITNLFFKEYTKEEKPRLSEEERNHLKNIFYEQTERLSERLEKDMIKYWNFD